MKKLKSWQNFWVKVLSGPPNCWQHIVSFAMKFDHELATMISTPEYLPAASSTDNFEDFQSKRESNELSPLPQRGDQEFFVAADANSKPAARVV